MKRTMLFVLVLAIALTTVGSAVFAQDNSAYCTNDPDDGSGLPGCVTPDDNECYVGGVLYRDANQDGCPSVWYWEAGWFLARFLDGDITREQVPVQYRSVLPPPPSVEEAAAAVKVSTCVLDLSGISRGSVTVPQSVLDVSAASKAFPGENDGSVNWMWHNGPPNYDLGYDYMGFDYHVYSESTSSWSVPTTGDCTVNTANLS